MASMRQAAQDVLDEARDGIAWIAVWKDGKGWMSMAFWPEVNSDESLTFEDYEMEYLRSIARLDPGAILVNGWYHNLGDTTCMTRDSLADAFRWQYERQHFTVADMLTERKEANK